MSQENEKVAKAAYAAINGGDLEGFLALVDPQVEFRSLIAEAEGSAYRGHDGVRDWWEGVAAALGGLRFEVQELDVRGDRAVTELLVSGTMEGVAVTQRMWQAVVFREGKVIWWSTFRTEAEAREAVESAGLSE